MDSTILEHILKNYTVWKRKQEQIESKFLQGDMTKWELVYASMELLAEHMPVKENNVTSATGRFK